MRNELRDLIRSTGLGNQQQERFGVVMLGRQTLSTVYTLERQTGLNTFCVCKVFPLALILSLSNAKLNTSRNARRCGRRGFNSSLDSIGRPFEFKLGNKKNTRDGRVSRSPILNLYKLRLLSFEK